MQRVGDDAVGRGEVGLDLTEGELPVKGDIGSERVVNQRRAILLGLHRIDDGFERFVFDLDQLGRILGYGPGLGRDGHHSLAGVADLVDGQAPPGVVLGVRAEVG